VKALVRALSEKFVEPDGYYVDAHAPMGPKDRNNYEPVNKFDQKTSHQKPFTKAEAKRTIQFHLRRKVPIRVRLVKGGRSKEIRPESV
jgi:hypothetical protein